jgi:lysophospholipase L1-like esterase
MRYLLYIFLFFCVACNTNGKQDSTPVASPPFWKDIQSFKKQDSISSPPKNAILLIGSSSFTMWKDVQDHFPGYTIVNRGFGGSTLLDQIRYADDIIFPYQPKQIVIYCGENDLASSDTVTAAMVVDRFKQLYQIIRGKTKAPILYISMKPSPSRRHLFQKMREANQLIALFLGESDVLSGITSKNVYIDVHQKMLNEAGEPIPEIFLEDSLHMSAKGYSIWQESMKPYLIK